MNFLVVPYQFLTDCLLVLEILKNENYQDNPGPSIQ